MNFINLQYFLVVYESKSIAQAAEKLFISRQSLSTAMYRLESEIGCVLFIRDQQGITPTAEAEWFYHQVKAILQIWKVTLQHIKIQKCGKRILKIACLPLSYNFITRSCINTFMEQNPDILLHISYMSSKKIFQMMREGELDIAITNYPGDETEIKGIPLVREKPWLLLNASSSLVNFSEITITEVGNKPMIFPQSAWVWLSEVKKVWNENGFELITIQQTDDQMQIAQMVSEGVGYYIIPETSVNKFLCNKLTARPLQISGFECSLFINVLKGCENLQELQFLIDFLLDTGRSYSKNHN